MNVYKKGALYLLHKNYGFMADQTPPKFYDTHTYTILGIKDPVPGVDSKIENSDIRKVLLRDGRPVNCHRQAPILMPKSIQTAGQPAYDIQRVLCSTDCGKAFIVGDVDGNSFFCQHCDAISARFPLEKVAGQDQEHPNTTNPEKKPFDRSSR